MDNQLNVECPNCKKDVVWSPDNKFRPFCSKNCKLIDLGEWASEGYVINKENSTNEDEDEINFES